MPLNFDLAGKTYLSRTITVTADQIEAYAEASGDDNPRHRVGADDQVASAVFAVVPGIVLAGSITTDPELNVENPLMIVHGEQAFDYHRPIRPGDSLVMTPVLESVEDKGKGATYVAKVSAATPDGDPVVDQYWTIFVRGAGSGTERPRGEKPAPPDKGEVVAAFTQHVSVDMPPAYAKASGDHNPIHLDDDVAKMVGLPGVINHGLGTLSLVAGGLVSRLADGDPTRLRSLRCRFTDLVLPGSDIETTVWSSGDGYLFETTRPDGTAVVAGQLVVG
ncbi:MAG TPA: MaoC/PaaZ C-terminal domain-containing protein [Acidimicrobiia bacterium]|nr:MaoC/PaaZ C-terminal domain-containing protein [Acidimicrobiia bacterium]